MKMKFVKTVLINAPTVKLLPMQIVFAKTLELETTATVQMVTMMMV